VAILILNYKLDRHALNGLTYAEALERGEVDLENY
jgi:hypothetical protein